MTDTFKHVHDGDTGDGTRFGLVSAQENTEDGKHNTATGVEQTKTTTDLVQSLNPSLGPSPGGEPFGRNVNLLETRGKNSFNALQKILLGIPTSGYGTTVQAPTVSPERRAQEAKLHPHVPAPDLYTEDGKPTAKLLQGAERVKLLQEAWANYQNNATSDPKLTPAEDFRNATAELYDSDPDNFLDGNAYLQGLHSQGTAGITAVPDSTTPLPSDPRNIIEQTLGAFVGTTADTPTHRVRSPLGVLGSSGGIVSDISDKLTEWGAQPSPKDAKELELLKTQFSEQDLKATEKMPLPQRVAHLKALSVNRANMTELANLTGTDSFKAQAFGLLSMLPGAIATDGMLGLAGKGASSVLEYADSIAAKKVATKYEADLATHIQASRAGIEANKAANIPFLMQNRVAQDATLRGDAEANITMGLTPQAAASKWTTRQKEALWQLTPKTLQDNLTNNAAYWKFGYQAAIKSPAMLYGFTEATEAVHGFVFNEDKTEGFHHLTPEEYGMGLAFGLLGHGAGPAYQRLTAKYDRLRNLQENLGIHEGTTAGYKNTPSGAVVNSNAAANLREVHEILQTHAKDKTPFSPEQEARLQELEHVTNDLKRFSTDIEKTKHYEDLSNELDKGVSPKDAKDLDLRDTLKSLKDPDAVTVQNHLSFLTPGGETKANLGNVRELLNKLKQGELRTKTASMLQFSGPVNNILKALDTGNDWVEKKGPKYRYKQSEKYRALTGNSETIVQNAITSLVSSDKFQKLPPEAQAKVLEPIAHHQLLRSNLHKDLGARKVALRDQRPVHVGVIGKHLIDTSKMKDGAAKDKATEVNEYLTEVHKRFDTEYQGTYFRGQIFKDLLSTPDWKQELLSKDQKTQQAISHAVELNPNIREWLKSENHENFVEDLSNAFTFNVKEQKFKLKEEDSSVTEVDPLPEGTTAPKQEPEEAVC